MKIEIELDPKPKIFRHASELVRESKGGYLEGCITFRGLGQSDIIDFIELDLVKDKVVKGGLEQNVHPNVLYVSENARKEKNSKGGIKQASIKSSDCNVRLEFRDGGIWIRHSYLKNGQFKITKGWCESDGVKKLTLGKEHLRLSVVKPKQKGLSNDSEPLQLNNVLACKLQKFGEVDQLKLKQLQEGFSAVRGKSGDDRTESSLFKVHLSVVCGLKDRSIIREISTNPIRDKAKHEVKGLTPTPRMICDTGRNVITVLMDNCKAIGDEFVLQNKSEKKIWKPAHTVKKQGYFRLYFEPIGPTVGSLQLQIQNVGECEPMIIEVGSHKPGKHDCKLCRQCREDWKEIKKQEKRKSEVSDVNSNAKKRKQGNQYSNRSSVDDRMQDSYTELDFLEDGDGYEDPPPAADSVCQAPIPGSSQADFSSQPFVNINPLETSYQPASHMNFQPNPNQICVLSQQPDALQNQQVGYSYPSYPSGNQGSFTEIAYDQTTENYELIMEHPSQQMGFSETDSLNSQDIIEYCLDNKPSVQQTVLNNHVNLTHEYQPFETNSQGSDRSKYLSTPDPDICTDNHLDVLDAILGDSSSPDSGLGSTNSPEEETEKSEMNQEEDENLKLNFEEDFDFDVEELLRLQNDEKEEGTFDFAFDDLSDGNSNLLQGGFGTSGLYELETDGAIRSKLPRATPQDSAPSILVIPEDRKLSRRAKENNSVNEMINILVIVGCILLAIFVRFYIS